MAPIRRTSTAPLSGRPAPPSRRLRFPLLRSVALLMLCLMARAGASGQASPPAIFQGGIVNAASFLPVGLPGSGIAQGSIFSIFGENLGPQDGLKAGEFPLAPALGGVSVEIRSATGETFAAWPLFVSAKQINAILPSRTPAGQSRVTVSWKGQSSQPTAVKVVRSSFGIFTRDLGGVEAAVAQKFVSEASQPLQSLKEPARPGQTLTVWGSGLGPIPFPDFMAPPAGNLETPIEVNVGNRPAAIAYRGRSPCCAGVDQINFRVPDDAPLGCFVPLSVQVQGVLYSNVATVAISATGEPCRPDPNPLTDPVAGPNGRILLRRTEPEAGDPPTPATGTNDLAEAFFWGPSGAMPEADLDALLRFALAEAGHPPVLPPAGTCLPLPAPTARPDAPKLRLLDAGNEILLRGPAGETALAREARSYRAAAPPGPLFLGPGSYRLEGSGGSEFPSFVAALQAAPAPVRFNEFEVHAASRLAGFSLEWTNTDPFWESILVWSLPPEPSRPGPPNLVCRVSPAAGSFAVPASAVANLGAAAARLRFGGLLGPLSLQAAAGTNATGQLFYQQEGERTVDFGRPHLPSTPLRLPNGAIVQAELATSPPEWARGLMHRPLLPVDQGMLFLFEIPGRYPFFMLNTLIPLDIIWLDSDRRVVFISERTPPCPPTEPICPTFGGAVTAQFVVELAAGQAEANGLAIGDQLEW